MPRAAAFAVLIALALLGGSAQCAVAVAGAVQRAPLSEVFREWRADDSAVTGRADGLVPAPVNADTLEAGAALPAGAVAALPGVTDLPSAYDLRSAGGLTTVRDQGSFGTCWAFAALGSLESTLLLAAGDARDYSEDNLARTAGYTLDPYTGGGNSLMATAYLSRWAGPVLESEDAYGDRVTPSGLSAKRHVQDVHFLPERTGASDNDAIKAALMEYGAVATNLYYGSGYYDARSSSYYCPSDRTDNHAVAIVGWDDAYSKGNFAGTPAGDGAFIVRNSWGTGWGDGGYFYVSYHDASLGRGAGDGEGDVAVFTSEAVSGHDTVYQYDPLGFVFASCDDGSPDPTAGWVANRFTMTGDGSLDRVSFYTLGEGSAYEVYVNDELVADAAHRVAGGTLALAGYHTITLETPVAVASGEDVYVMVRIETPGCGYPLALEGHCAGYSEAAASSPGQSYMAADVAGAAGGWEDIGGGTAQYNVCLKAFVDEGPATDADGLAADSGPGWVAGGAVTVTLTASGGAGDLTTYYWIDGGGRQTYTGPFTVSGDGSHAVDYYSADSTGMTEAIKTGYVNIDGVTPVIDVAGADDAWHASAVALAFAPVTGPSGVKSVEYRVNDGAWTEVAAAGGVYTASVAANGTSTVSYRTTNGAGACSAEGSCTVKVDTVPPRLRLETRTVRVRVRAGARLAVRLRWNDAVSSSCRLRVKITQDGRQRAPVRTLTLSHPGSWQTVRVPWRLSPGVYSLRLTLYDAVGNHCRASSRIVARR